MISMTVVANMLCDPRYEIKTYVAGNVCSVTVQDTITGLCATCDRSSIWHKNRMEAFEYLLENIAKYEKEHGQRE